jgi:molecular chaperone GrpE
MKNKDKNPNNEVPPQEPQQAKPEQPTEVQDIQKELDDIRKQVEQAQKEQADTLSKLQRVSADYANYQKRVPRQIADAVSYEKESFIRSLLPALDNFERAIGHEPASAESLLKGIRMVYDQMLGILKTNGVEQIQALGQHFDPSLHSAIQQVNVPGKEDNTVVEEFAKGYKFNERVIRPARVAVNKKTAAPSAPAARPQETDGEVGAEDESTDTE